MQWNHSDGMQLGQEGEYIYYNSFKTVNVYMSHFLVYLFVFIYLLFFNNIILDSTFAFKASDAHQGALMSLRTRFC